MSKTDITSIATMVIVVVAAIFLAEWLKGQGFFSSKV
jgi:hypothetical protein